LVVPPVYKAPSIAQTASDYLHLWKRETPGEELVLEAELGEFPEIYYDPIPGSWPIDGLYNFWFNITSASGVEEVPEQNSVPSIRVYPNPASSEFIVDGTGLPARLPMTLQLYNCKGELIRTKTIDASDASRKTIMFPGQGLASGIYWIRMAASDGHAIARPKRVVIMR
jgi:hypothetical protein